MEEQEHEIEKLKSEPILPVASWIASTFLFISAYCVAYYDKIINLLVLTSLTGIILFLLTYHYLQQSIKNKKKLYIAYHELLKNLKSQRALREKADEENNRLKLALNHLIKQRKDDHNGHNVEKRIQSR